MANSDLNTVLNLIQPLTQSDPRLYDALKKLITWASRVDQELFPPLVPTLPQTVTPVPIPDVTVFTYILKKQSVQLSWIAPSASILRYEIRQGSVWETANSLLTTDSLSAEIDPLPVGSTKFLIKAKGEAGTESPNAMSLEVIVPPLGIISIEAKVIDNNVLLYWTEPDSAFKIDHYIVYKNTIVQGNQTGTFTSIFESVSGTYDYAIRAVDVASNLSAIFTIQATVAQPPDYELQANYTSLLTGTKTNAYLSTVPFPKLLVCVNTTETWAQHFSTHSWTNIQDQINAGYPIFAQPAQATAAYEEVIDYGLIISSTVATPNYNTQLIAPTGVNIVLKLAYSDDNITYSADFVVTSSLFVPSLRYLKVKVEFTSIDDTSLLEFYNLTVRLDVKKAVDSGRVNALSTDVSGTIVNFNKAFKDIDSVVGTVQNVNEFIVVIDFVDVPNPTFFHVYVFDSAGNRASQLVYWVARGIL